MIIMVRLKCRIFSPFLSPPCRRARCCFFLSACCMRILCDLVLCCHARCPLPMCRVGSRPVLAGWYISVDLRTKFCCESKNFSVDFWF